MKLPLLPLSVVRSVRFGRELDPSNDYKNRIEEFHSIVTFSLTKFLQIHLSQDRIFVNTISIVIQCNESIISST